ncbi:MAG: hypothetical protein R3F33_15195, partial [Planctomycetota bacterium]
MSLTACGGGGGGGTVPGVPGGSVAPEGGALHPSAGLTALVPADGQILVRWQVTQAPGSPPPLALFLGTDPLTLTQGSPLGISAASGSQTIGSLSNGTEYHMVLGAQVNGSWQAMGPTLRVRPGVPVYVQAGADPNVADGSSPQTAFADLATAIGAAQAGSGNVYVGAGTYAGVAVQVPAGVRLYGGFGPALSLADWDPATHATILGNLGSQPVLFLAKADGDATVVSGVRIDGGGASEAALEVDERVSDLTWVTVSGAVRGFKLRSLNLFDPIPVTMAVCTASGCQVGGASVDGAFNLWVSKSTFRNNLQEGMSCNDLLGLGSDITRLWIEDCSFVANGSEGLEVDLVADLAPSTGRWDLRISDSEFVGNALDGCLLDCDYEGSPGWTARIDVRGIEARDNGLAGLHLDLDAANSTVVHRGLFAANRGDGLLITSESAPGMATIEACAMLGNQGYGVRTNLGNVGAALSHCVLSGNGAGGFAAQLAPGSAVSTVAWLQENPWTSVSRAGCRTTSVLSPAPFERAPVEWLQVQGAAAGGVQVAALGSLVVGDWVELGADHVLRTVTGIAGNNVTLDPAPVAVSAPQRLARFATASVTEDWNPASGSVLIASGMGPVGGPDPDQGPFGALQGGTPGFDAFAPPALFRLA